MKKKVMREVNFCDFCDAEDCYYSCNVCGKHVCYDCKKIYTIEYSHSVYCSGSGDGLYCNECDSKTNDTLIRAYRKIKALRNEIEGWNAQFQIKKTQAESELKKLIENNRKK